MKKIIRNIDPKPICLKLKELRLSLGFANAKRFAEHLGLNYTTYRNYEKDRLPPIELLFLIKTKYARDVNIDGLFENIAPEAHGEAAEATISPKGVPEHGGTEKRSGKDRRK